MSPALTSVAPVIVRVLGGHQSARTIHFAIAALLTLFVAGHVAMVVVTGFGANLIGMITGDGPARKEVA
jgi:thiosulfate reductase cytochrome b subunit